MGETSFHLIAIYTISKDLTPLFFQHIVLVTNDLVINNSFSTDDLERSIENMNFRNCLSECCIENILPILQKHKLVDTHFYPHLPPETKVPEAASRQSEFNYEQLIPDYIDYIRECT